MRDDSDRAIASGHNIALLGIVDIAAVAVADGLQQRAVGAVAHCVDRAGEVERDRSGVAGSAGIGEVAVKNAAAAAQGLDDDADGVGASGQHIAGLGVVDIPRIAAANALQQHAVRAVARGLDRAGEVERDGPGGAGAGIADEVAVDVAARAANRLGDDADRAIALGDDVAGLAIIDVAAGAANGLQQHAVRPAPLV